MGALGAADRATLCSVSDLSHLSRAGQVLVIPSFQFQKNSSSLSQHKVAELGVSNPQTCCAPESPGTFSKMHLLGPTSSSGRS